MTVPLKKKATNGGVPGALACRLGPRPIRFGSGGSSRACRTLPTTGGRLPTTLQSIRMGRGRTPRHTAETHEPFVATDAGAGPCNLRDAGAFAPERVSISFPTPPWLEESFPRRSNRQLHRPSDGRPSAKPSFWLINRVRRALAIRSVTGSAAGSISRLSSVSFCSEFSGSPHECGDERRGVLPENAPDFSRLRNLLRPGRSFPVCRSSNFDGSVNATQMKTDIWLSTFVFERFFRDNHASHLRIDRVRARSIPSGTRAASCRIFPPPCL